MPFCTNCGTKYETGTKFCGSCGNRVEFKPEEAAPAPAAPVAPAAPAAPEAPVTPPAAPAPEAEKTLWEGKPSGLTARMLDKAKLNATTFILTNQRIIVKSGLIAKKQDEIELVRVQDIQLRQDLKDRVLGVGDILVFSTDRTTPALELIDVRDAFEVREKIRTAVREEKHRLGTNYREIV